MSAPEHITKPCKRCGALLEIKRNWAANEEFLGCARWPDCSYTEKLPETIKLRRQGVKDMFDDPPAPAD